MLYSSFFLLTFQAKLHLKPQPFARIMYSILLAIKSFFLARKIFEHLFSGKRSCVAELYLYLSFLSSFLTIALTILPLYPGIQENSFSRPGSSFSSVHSYNRFHDWILHQRLRVLKIFQVGAYCEDFSKMLFNLPRFILRNALAE